MSKTGVTITIPTPECDKLLKVASDSQKIGDFLEWLQERGIQLAEYPEDREQLIPIFTRREQLLADYFEIDLTKVERERQAMLQGLRAVYHAEGKS